MKKFLKKFSKQNIREVRQELARAHLIITFLSVISIALLYLGATLTVAFDAALSIVAAALLTLLIIISLSISITLFTDKK